MSLYWLCYRHNNQISVVIEPGASLTAPAIAGSVAYRSASSGLRLWYSTLSKPCRCIAQCLHWLMLPILWVFSATRARTMRTLAGSCQSSESAFKRSCAFNGRTRKDFRLWQDKVAIAHGELWEDTIKKGISESVFFIPIITPTAVRSSYCKFEFESFLAREKELDRNNLIFPILYVPV